MKAFKAVTLFLLMAIGLSSCIVTSPGYGPRRGYGHHHHGHGHGHYRR